MSAHYRCGLVVGKFCPLHRGHGLVIGHALAHCDEVLIISYTKPGFSGYDCALREAWLKARFPRTIRLVIDDARLATQCKELGIARLPSLPADDAPELEHREFVAWLCTDLLHRRPDAVFTSEDYGDGFARVLAEQFAQPVAHVCVDKARVTHPISGTQIRNNPHRHRTQLYPEVYASFVRRIGILGGESSGKTTLARALAANLDTTWVPEYGRELWECKDGQLVFDDMVAIGRMQVEKERMQLAHAQRFLICDTSPLTTLFYSHAMFGQADPELVRLAERGYDTIILCSPDIEFIQDGTRRDSDFRQRQHQWYLEYLNARGIAHLAMSGPPEKRLAAAMAYIADSALKAPLGHIAGEVVCKELGMNCRCRPEGA
ncbi:MAG: AAA family ATPase [Rhodocyclaceae bacterium]|nr:AAA family ATPase [Rhodocyclaceae bacterium]